MGIVYQVDIPGKTFLVGEYLALDGGPSIVLNTAPCFRFSWEVGKADGHPSVPFHSQSPAGLLWADVSAHAGSTSTYHMEFTDPHGGRGGLGASTAEFLGVWTMQNWLRDPASDGETVSLIEQLENQHSEISPLWKSDRVGSGRFRDLLDGYRKYEQRGSGADLVSQATGGIAVWDGQQDVMRKFVWCFQDLGFTLIRTEQKLPTHQHLSTSAANLSPEFTEDMRDWVKEAVQSFALADGDRLVASVRGTGKLLEDSGRLAPHSKSIIEDIDEMQGIRAAKGCGAMGSDIVLVLHDDSTATVESIRRYASEKSLSIAGSHNDLYSGGLAIRRTK